MNTPVWVVMAVAAFGGVQWLARLRRLLAERMAQRQPPVAQQPRDDWVQQGMCYDDAVHQSIARRDALARLASDERGQQETDKPQAYAREWGESDFNLTFQQGGQELLRVNATDIGKRAAYARLARYANGGCQCSECRDTCVRYMDGLAQYLK